MRGGKLNIALLFCCLTLVSVPLAAGEYVEKKQRVSVSGKKLTHAASSSSEESALDSEQKYHGPFAGYHAPIFSNSWSSTSHYGAYHSVVSISDSFSLLEGSVELEDGSIWAIWYEDIYKTSNWLATDLIVISRNKALFSSYDFKITNQNTGASILANLYMGPFYDSLYRRWVAAIDDYNNLVYLDDGSVWSMSTFDFSIIYEWSVGDTVIIGVSDSIFNPNFLLNVDLMTYASGKAYN